MKKLLTLVLGMLVLISCGEKSSEKNEVVSESKKTSTVVLNQEDGKFQLYVNSEPYYIKGAGLEFGDIPSVKAHGGNSFRTWRTDNGQRPAKDILDEAHANGLTVTMGIEVARERHGFDYDDEVAVKAQLERIKKEVLDIKDHPALIIWAVGNELNLNYTNPKVWDAVNDISKMIHEIDPNHLTTTTLAGITKKEIDLIKERCSDIDILSVQMYGDLPNVPKLIKEYGWEGAYMVTEWGATGHWEVPKTEWGAPIEEHSSLKASNYLKRYKMGIEADKIQCIGSYVFLWGNKQERTPTWYGIFLPNGQETESVDVMHYIWNGTWPANRTPQIESFTLNGKTAYDIVKFDGKTTQIAEIKCIDHENDNLSYSWEILPESTDLQHGGDYEEKPASEKLTIISEQNGRIEFVSPEKKGAYRIFVYVDDGNKHAATANIPFWIN